MPGAGGSREDGELVFRGYRVIVWDDEKVLKWLGVRITQHCVHTKSH